MDNEAYTNFSKYHSACDQKNYQSLGYSIWRLCNWQREAYPRLEINRCEKGQPLFLSGNWKFLCG